MGGKYRKKRECHGGTGTRLYNIHYNMLERCTNPKCKDYPRYGGRGITVAKEFKHFADFRKWFQTTFTLDDVPKGLTLDRENNDGNYHPDNMRLATQKEQQNNRCTNKRIKYKGEERTISQWSDKTGIPRKTLEKRLRFYGWSVEKSLTTPVKANWKYVEHNGERHTLNEWAKITDIGRSTIEWRLNAGWSIERSLTEPPRIKR